MKSLVLGKIMKSLAAKEKAVDRVVDIQFCNRENEIYIIEDK